MQLITSLTRSDLSVAFESLSVISYTTFYVITTVPLLKAFQCHSLSLQINYVKTIPIENTSILESMCSIEIGKSRSSGAI